MTQRISGKNFDITVGDFSVRVAQASLEITDNSAVAKDSGVPNGWVDGDVEASGELQVDASNLKLIVEAAGKAGSFRSLAPSDITFFAKTPNNEIKVQAFGCKLKVSSLLDIDTNGGEKHLTTIPFDVTSPDFVRINGVRYLSKADTDGLI
ncbi:tail protein [Endozoicomonas montiporae]|uniref:Tail protein n=2 Tax=Endozoicomonas montiporae TaxID=1027273 RepID=A0A081NB92_9GAMM|nr:phage protein [Endozoicomonas montiporae]AMO56559.1 prophage PSPPH06, tail tube protein [Endozoicomonas montiporae CL-33]KEQ15715.1 tail protein [Endozoicomonas montiporae]